MKPVKEGSSHLSSRFCDCFDLIRDLEICLEVIHPCFRSVSIEKTFMQLMIMAIMTGVAFMVPYELFHFSYTSSIRYYQSIAEIEKSIESEQTIIYIYI